MSTTMQAIIVNGEVVGYFSPNASSIEFDNTGTNLSSTDVEEAIKEVNEKFDNGSVSVTADNDTYSSLLAKLSNAIDWSKLSPKLCIVKDNDGVFNCSALQPDNLISAARTDCYEQSTDIVAFQITKSAQRAWKWVINTSGNTFTNLSDTSVPNGTILTLYY